MVNFVIVILFGAVVLSGAHQTSRISNKRLCADPECKTPISEAIAIIQYSGDHELLVNTKRGDTVTVYSKNAGLVESLWGIENRGKRGYHPKSLLKEIKVFNSSPKYEVPTELETMNSGIQESSVSSAIFGVSAELLENNNLKPDSVNSLEIVDGTTLYPKEGIEEIEPTVTFSTVEPTVHISSDNVNVKENINVDEVTFNSDNTKSMNIINADYEVEVIDPTVASNSVEPTVDQEQASSDNLNVKEYTNVDEVSYNSDNIKELNVTNADHEVEEIDLTVTSTNVEPILDQVSSNNVDVKENINVYEENYNSENTNKFNFRNEDNDGEEVKDLLESQVIEMEEKKSELSADKLDSITEDEYSKSEDIAENLQKMNNINEPLNINEEPEIEDDSREVKFDSKEDREYENDEESLSDSNENFDSSENTSISDDTNNILTPNTGNVTLPNESNNADHKPETNLDENVEVNSEFSDNTATLELTSHSQDNVQLVTTEHIEVNDTKSDQTENTESPIDNIVEVNESYSFNGASVEITDGKQEVELVDSKNEISEAAVNLDDIGSVVQQFMGTVENNESNLDSSNIQNVEQSSANEITHKTAVETETSDFSYQTQYSDDIAITELPITESIDKGNEEMSSGVDQDALEKNVLEVETKAPPEDSLFTRLIDTLFSGFKQVSNIFSDVEKDVNSNVKMEEESASVNIANIPSGEEEANISPKNKKEAIDTNYGADKNVLVCEIGAECSKGTSEFNLIPGAPHTTFGDKAERETDFPGLSTDMLYVLVVTAVTVLCFILGYYYLEKRQHDMFFITKMNKLEKSLLYYKNEASSIKEELKRKEDTLSTIESSSCDSDKTIIKLQLELESFKEKNTELEEQVSSLEKELETATETGLELNRMLSDFLSSQHGSESLVKSVEHLQKQLDSQQNTISEMNTNLNAKNRENESLQCEMKAANEKIINLQEELDKVTDTLILVQKEKLDIETKLEERNHTLHSQLIEMSEKHQQEISHHMVQIADAQTALEEARETIAMRDSELTVLQDCLKELKAFEDGQGSERLNALLDVGHARAELMIITLERDGLKDRVKDEEDARKLLEDHVKIIQEEVSNLHLRYEEADKEKREAETKLEVLSNYFKEKETQLQKELGLQEAMCIQKEGDVCSTVEKIKSLQEEIQNYKSQNEILKKEIVDQERSLKGQISTLEKKAHENWVAVRQAERKLEESRQEAGTLRNRLTVVEKNLTNTSQNDLDATRVSDRLTAAESNGELPTSLLHLGIPELQDSPLHYHQHRDGHPVSPSLIPGQPLPPPFMGIPPALFIPPPPIPGVPFMPPPPPPLFPGDRRPPPLGRMSSPPPTRHYSPEPVAGFSPYDRTSPEHFTDDPPPGRFRHITPPPHLDSYAPRQPPLWDEPRSDFRPMPISHRDSPHESKGSALSSAHSSESLGKSSRHSGRV